MIHSDVPVIIDDLHVKRIAILPLKANSPLIVDADAVLALALAFESLQAVGGRDAQVVQRDGVVEHTQFAASDGLDVAGQTTRERARPDSFGVLVREVPYHVATITHNVI